MNIVTITLKSLWHQRIRTILTILGVGISIAAYVSLRGITNNLEKTLQATYKVRGTDLIAMERGTLDILSSGIDQSYTEKIKLLPHVKDASSLIMYLYAINFKQYFMVYGWDGNSYLFNELKIQGHSPQRENEVILGEIAAKRLKKQTGETINIRGKEFFVVGIFHGPSMLEDGMVILPLGALQEIKKVGNKITAINIRLDIPEPWKLTTRQQERISAEVLQEITARFPDLEVKSLQNFVSTPFSVIFNFTWAISVVAFIIMIMGIANTMTTAVLERTKEIGILLAIGWRKTRIISLVIFESALLGLAGGIVGVILGYVIMNVLAVTPQIQSFVTMTYDIEFIARAIVLSLLAGILSGVYPALKAVSIEPIEVLRYE